MKGLEDDDYKKGKRGDMKYVRYYIFSFLFMPISFPVGLFEYVTRYNRIIFFRVATWFPCGQRMFEKYAERMFQSDVKVFTLVS